MDTESPNNFSLFLVVFLHVVLFSLVLFTPAHPQAHPAARVEMGDLQLFFALSVSGCFLYTPI